MESTGRGSLSPPLPPPDFRGATKAPGDKAHIALKSAQDGFKTTSRRDEDDKMTTRRKEGVLNGFKRAPRRLKIAT